MPFLFCCDHCRRWRALLHTSAVMFEPINESGRAILNVCSRMVLEHRSLLVDFSAGASAQIRKNSNSHIPTAALPEPAMCWEPSSQTSSPPAPLLRVQDPEYPHERFVRTPLDCFGAHTFHRMPGTRD